MNKRGRKSSAELATAPVEIDAKRQRPPPPEHLTDPERDIWLRIVAAMPGGWFGREHLDLLARYCQHQCRANRFNRMASAVKSTDIPDGLPLEEWDRLLRMAERETRAALALARSMRITHQSQLRAETAATRRSNEIPPEFGKPWEV